MIGNEKGKSRMTVDTALRKKSWRLLCLSSGEIGISEKIEAVGERVHGGVLVRCIDIEAQSAKGSEYVKTCEVVAIATNFQQLLLNEYENGKVKRRNPKIIVDNEREKRYLEIIIT